MFSTLLMVKKMLTPKTNPSKVKYPVEKHPEIVAEMDMDDARRLADSINVDYVH